MDYILTNIIETMSNVLGVIMVLWLRRRMPLFSGAHAEVLKDEES